MPALTHLSLVTPASIKFDGDVEIVIAPGAAGDLGVLANHAPLLTSLRAGVVKADAVEAGRIEFAVDGGFMQVVKDRVIVLTETALTAQDVDVEAARSDLKRAEEALALKKGDDEKAERQAVAWAQARLDVAHRPGSV